MGKVSLEGMEFYARHGYYEEERIIGNKYSVDVTIEVDFSEAAETDHLEGTVNYEKVYEIVAGVMAVDALLLEHLAGKIIKDLKAHFPRIKSTTVKVSKYNPPIKGLCQRAVVEMEG
ncbi:dihydroneopterin aldolase [Marinoscillum sp. MHG1-6]|uniref:dihydroneopterin aldolase n=1 Tax=Marinoscillum sp. MHG1-6 TaxID=2959627 RepID=UPI0021578577|nr:dihydroneopterin aldolase [Marinoscillum sp. MHG1-6]